MNKVVSFSGGQTSGYMLHLLMKDNPHFRHQYTVVFCNTGKEHDATLDFVHEVETKWNIPIVWLEYTRIPAIEIDSELVPDGRKRTNLIKQQKNGESAHWFRVVNYETAARRFDKRTPFDEMLEWAGTIPNVRTRQCSVQLKLRTMQRWLRANGVESYQSHIGIRKDEEHRKHEILANLEKGEWPQFPLVDKKVTKQIVDAFWDSHPFKLNIPNHMGNCDLCFLKARWKRVAAARQDPKAAQWWADWEEKFKEKTSGDGSRWSKSESYASIIADANHPELNIFYDGSEDIPCSCAVGGFRVQNQED